MMESKKIRNPFPGLRPFETDEYRLFFGREGQSDELIARLQRARFLAVVGASGSGKSSLIRAGLLPALRGGLMAGAGSGWRIAVMRPGGDPIGNLAGELAKKDALSEAGAGLIPAEAEAVIEATLRGGSLGLVDVARQGRLAADEKLLVVVDQFEELFRFRAAREKSSTDNEAPAFVKLLLEASQQRDLSIFVVLTMRSDFLGDCAQFQGLPEAINEGQYLIPRQTRDERRVAITGPVGVTRGKITEPLVNRLLNDVGDNPDQLPILQHALMRTWDHWAAHRRNGEPIGIEHYQAIGTMADALSLHADEAFNELPDDRSRLIAEIVFKALSERGADNREIRRPTRLNEICNIAHARTQEVIAVIDVFRGGGRSFLMPPAGVALEPETVIDISHESLIRNWQRLKDWVNEEAQSARIYRRLAEAAVLNREGSEGLLQDPALQIALDWHEKSQPNAAWGKRYHPEFETAIAYLDVSRTAREAEITAQERDREEQLARERRELEMAKRYAEEQRRAAQRLRRLTFALVLISLLAVGTAAFALKARAEAETSRTAATEAQGRVEKLNESLFARFDAEKKLKEEAERQKGLAETRQTQALEEKRRAEKATKRAVISEGNARAAQTVALQQRAIALRKAKEAEDSLIKLQEQTDRNRWSRDGLAAFQRGDYQAALSAFDIVRESTQRDGDIRDGEIKDPEMARIYGWTLANIAAAYREMGQLSDSVASYEKALKILEETLDPDDPVRFDTYYGLAHAYRERYEVQQAENFYKRALAFLEENLAGKPSKIAEGLENMARLYRNSHRHAEAEPLYKRVVKIREEKADSPELVATLKEVSKFYVGQNKYKEAETLYSQILTIQEKRFISGELGDTNDETGEASAYMSAVADSYRDLGEVHIGLNDELKAKAAFQLARSLQDFWAKLRQFSRRATVGEGLFSKDFGDKLVALALDKDMNEMAEWLIVLGRFKTAESFYHLALQLAEDARAEGGHKDHKSVAQTFINAGDLYRINLKEYDKAEHSYNEAAKLLVKDDHMRADLGFVLDRLAGLYADHLNKPAQAEEMFKRALDAFANTTTGKLWVHEEKTLSALAELYRRQKKDAELEQTYTRRMEMMNRHLADYTGRYYRSAEAPKFLAAYVRAVGEVTEFYQLRKKSAQAETAYEMLFAAARPIRARVYDVTSLGDFASTLKKYQTLLRLLNKPADVAKVEEVVKSVLTRENELQEIRRQQQVQEDPPLQLKERPPQ
jgi:tetratricopeptide (TPR) repeat protein